MEVARLRSGAASQLGEWVALHRLLHELLDALTPLAAGIAATDERAQLDALRRGELYVNWRPCQARMYRLVEFGEGVQWIGPRFSREARHLSGAPWAVEIAALRLAIEDALSDPNPSRTDLIELVDELSAACHRHLAIASREIGDLAAERARPNGAAGGLRV
jgi:hypothetical protein